MNSQYKKGILEVCILALIQKDHQTTYQLTKALKETLDVTENTVYPMLRRLSQKGFLEVRKENSEFGAPKKVYQLTDLGFSHLSQEKTEWSKFSKTIHLILGESDE